MAHISDTQQLNFFTYILICSDNTLYTGWTTDLESRVETHNDGRGAKYTRARLPVSVVCSWAFETKNEAMSFEVAIKRLSRTEKFKLLRGDYPIQVDAKLNGRPRCVFVRSAFALS